MLSRNISTNALSSTYNIQHMNTIMCIIILTLSIIVTRSEALFARLLIDCELSYCFHWVIVVVGGRVHEWCKKGSGIKGHIL